MPPGYYTADNFGPLNNFSYNSFDGSITVNCDNMSKEILEQVLGITNNTKKETKKMEAKKCDRCGKLYEMPGAGENNGADVRFKFIHVHGSEDMSGKKIVERQTRRIWVKAEYDGDVDLCPDCRASLKKWFEGADKEDKKNV